MVWTLHLKGDVLDAQDLVDLPSQLVDARQLRQAAAEAAVAVRHAAAPTAG